MKEVRAVVLGAFVVLLVAIAIGYWRRPVRELKRVSGYHVEIEKTEAGAKKHISFTVPMSFVARIASMVPFADIGRNVKSDWGDGQVTARDILDAAGRSTPGKPGVITHDRTHIEVSTEGSAIEIAVTDDWDRHIRVRVPRALVESLSGQKRISARDLLKRLDEMGPGDVVIVRDGDDQVTITAQAR